MHLTASFTRCKKKTVDTFHSTEKDYTTIAPPLISHVRLMSIVYVVPIAAASRAVWLLIKILQLDVRIEIVRPNQLPDLFKGENPPSLPLLIESDFRLETANAILRYLAMLPESPRLGLYDVDPSVFNELFFVLMKTNEMS